MTAASRQAGGVAAAKLAIEATAAKMKVEKCMLVESERGRKSLK